MNDLANTPRPPALQSLHDLLLRVLVDLAMRLNRSRSAASAWLF